MSKYVKQMRDNHNMLLCSRIPNTKGWSLIIYDQDLSGGFWVIEDYSKGFKTKTSAHHMIFEDRQVGFILKIVNYKTFKVVQEALGARPDDE